jgi:hypothetical protein
MYRFQSNKPAEEIDLSTFLFSLKNSSLVLTKIDSNRPNASEWTRPTIR